MSQFPIYIDWFFHNTEVLWTAIILTTILIPLSMHTNLEKLVYAAMTLSLVLSLVAVGVGIVNIIRADRCDKCGTVIPVTEQYYACPCQIEVDASFYIEGGVACD